ncbi:MAG: DUF2461 domain-containing protein [Vicinamibacterales bacterium]
MSNAAPGFSDRTIRFLRALKRHNDREWFHARRAEYDAHVHAPMVAVIEQLAVDFAAAAPEFVASPTLSMFRPWRDTRFSADKKPLKTHIAAVFPHRELGRLRGAGLYFEVTGEYVWIGGGVYAPETPALHALRGHVAEHHRRLRRLLAAPPFTRTLGAMHGATLTRVPRGFDPSHPAADLLRHKQFLASREEPAAFATRPDFYRELLRTFTAMVPFVRFLNEPLLALARETARDPLVDRGTRGRFERVRR